MNNHQLIESNDHSSIRINLDDLRSWPIILPGYQLEDTILCRNLFLCRVGDAHELYHELMFLFSTPTIFKVNFDGHILWSVNERNLLKLPYQRVIPYSFTVEEDFWLKYLISL
jgi:hypothetical protein